MSYRFHDRAEAGRMLAKKLDAYAGRRDVVVLGLPRGGVVVAYEVARGLRAALDVFLVRKLGVPGHEELAMGAIGSGGVSFLNDSVIASLGIDQHIIDAAMARERLALERGEAIFRTGPLVGLRGKVVILVDDGMATGASMRAAVLAVQKRQPHTVVVAVPVADAGTVKEFQRDVAETVCVQTPENFEGVGQWYKNFAQTSEEEVRAMLAVAKSGHFDDKPIS